MLSIGESDPKKANVEEPYPEIPMTDKLESNTGHGGNGTTEYRLYRRRFLGCAALCLLNLVGGLNWLWFSAISIDTANAFHFSISQVNWLSNTINVVYLPTSFVIPWLARRYGVQNCAFLATASFFLAGWLRYAGTAKSLTPKGAYTLLIIGQLLAGFSQPWCQILAPKFSELWFGLEGRTTATMLVSFANPIGSALAQLLSPIVGTPKQSVLVLAIISSAIAPVVFLIGDKPPTPPTFAGSNRSPAVMETIRSFFGLLHPGERGRRMTFRQKIDFVILILAFGCLVGVLCAFSILVAQVYSPYGYDSTQSGIVGAALLIAGIVGALVTAPLFDRWLAHYVGITIRISVPAIGAGWLSMIWAVGHGLTPSYVVLAVVGFLSFMLLPLALELACEVTGNAEFSSAALWFSGNMFSMIFVLVSDRLKAGASANPPYNLRNTLILQGSFALAIGLTAVFIEGKQVRRELDERQGGTESELRTIESQREAMSTS